MVLDHVFSDQNGIKICHKTDRLLMLHEFSYFGNDETGIGENDWRFSFETECDWWYVSARPTSRDYLIGRSCVLGYFGIMISPLNREERLKSKRKLQIAVILEAFLSFTALQGLRKWLGIEEPRLHDCLHFWQDEVKALSNQPSMNDIENNPSGDISDRWRAFSYVVIFLEIEKHAIHQPKPQISHSFHSEL